MSSESALAGISEKCLSFKLSVEELIAQQAEANPTALAISTPKGAMSYGELEERAGILANVLRGLGVGPEVVVGVCAGRSAAMVVGALAALKAQGAYLPLDPLNPDARLTAMVNDAEARAVIAVASTQSRVASWGGPVIVLDDLGRIIGGAAAPESLPPAARADVSRLAYIIYTSGSTGNPNGVEVTQANLLNLLAWTLDMFQLNPSERASLVASVGFDAAVWEIWPYLVSGGSLHVPEDQVVRDPESLREWLLAQGITIGFVPTPMAEILLGMAWPASTALRRMLIGADTLHRYPREGLPFQLYNNYGPTECTVVATTAVVPADATRVGLPSIGYAVANTPIFILDEAGQPVADGTEGEMYIGGPQLARGYRKRPELTAKRFVPDTVSGQPGRKLFKTGDLAKRLPDGQFAFIRRMDDQVKVRGYRVEPSEIGAIISRHPGILQSLVVVRPTPTGDRRLVAYVVPRPEGFPTLSELRRYIGSRVPDYMVPETFVRLETMPLSTNGKMSRTNLPEPTEANTLAEAQFTGPRSEMEKTVADILCHLLGVEKVDVLSNFFVLGAHSLIGAQLIARLRRIVGVEMSLRVLFTAPTVAALSAEIERQQAAKRAHGTAAAAPEPAGHH